MILAQIKKITKTIVGYTENEFFPIPLTFARFLDEHKIKVKTNQLNIQEETHIKIKMEPINISFVHILEPLHKF